MLRPQMTARTVCAVIVSYNPSSDLLIHIEALRPQVQSLVVVDNGSSPEDLLALRKGSAELGFKVIENGCNRGIAFALNQGVEEATTAGFPWVALFDQDSVVPPDFMDLMFQAYNDSAFRSQAGIICPTYCDNRTDTVLPLPCSKTKEILAAPTSGTLFPVEIFRRLGPFNEDLFIDYVDVEFSLRVRKAGYTIIQSSQALLRHSMGKITRHRFARRWFITTNHSAARRYYITRNRIWVLARYWTDWSWSPKEMKSACAEAIKIIFVERYRLTKFRNIFLGFADAMIGHMGKRTEL